MPAKKSLLYIGESIFPDSYGNSSVYLYHLAKQAAHTGYKVTVVVSNPGNKLPATERNGQITIHRYPVEYEGKINYYLSLIKGADAAIAGLLETEKPFDIIHFFHHIPALGARLNGKLKRTKNTVFTHFGSLSREYLVRDAGREKGAGYREQMGLNIESSVFPLLMDNIEARNLGKCQHVITLTDFARKELIDQIKLRKDRVSTVRAGANTAEFSPATRCAAQKTRASDGWQFGWVGELDSIHAPDLFVDLCALLSEIYPGARFLMIGTGEDRQAVLSHINSYGLQSQFRLLPNQPSIAAELAACDLLVSTCMDERVRLIYTEAFACGTPTAAFHTGGIGEYLADGVNAVVANRGDVKDMARKIVDFMKSVYPTLDRGQLRHLATPLDWRVVFDAVDGIYQSILNPVAKKSARLTKAAR